jgi:hypothetical protein
LKKEELIR